MKINKLITNYNHNEGAVNRIKYIVIHYTANPNEASAKANCEYYASGNVGASAHYFVDFDGSIWQSVEDKDIAWHCGSGGKTYRHPECRNANSLGIEMCVRNKGNKSATSSDWYFEEATVNATIELTKMLMTKYGIDLSHVLRHYDVTGKYCPNPYVLDPIAWDSFKLSLTSAKYKPKTWYSDDKGWWYAKTGNTYAHDEFLVINQHKYYFDSEGYAIEGLYVIDGATYFFATKEISEQYQCAMMDVKLFE